MLSLGLGFPGGRVIAPLWHQRPLVFLKGCCHHKSQTNWCNGSHQTIIKLHVFLFYCLFILCRATMTRVILKVILIDISIFWEKKDKRFEQTSPRIIILQQRNWKWGIAFLFSKIWLWWSIDSEFNGVWRCVCRSPFIFSFFSEFGFGSYLTERGGSTQHAFWQCWRASGVGTHNIVHKDIGAFHPHII